MEQLVHLLLAIAALVTTAHAHGRLLEPPSRSSMWRYGFKSEPNYNDNQLFCGGFYVQWTLNNGKCGVCGDNWAGPRDNEPGGKYAKGIIVRKYDQGAEMKVSVHLTANHKGYFEFRLCANDNANVKVDQECFDQHLLYVKSTGSTRLPITSTMKHINVVLLLPGNVRCRACVLQWKYNTGNSWGRDETGRGCSGCGPQEQFYGCADVAIGHDDVEVGKSEQTKVVVPDGDDDESNPWEKEDDCLCSCNANKYTSGALSVTSGSILKTLAVAYAIFVLNV